ncbi:MAG: patatin-like phospholipase family protein [Flavobacteriales bacterium]|jgi:NTE family protein|nr:patatin-like phospholipase family protein [Flavobacteriales bacterium]MBK7111562.1 patatin-like phospholipase family protein [Flavobacteriales bacterium]MBK7618428.1 patatin-like phospholipase family protein [Flavobacteriales bacterium]MBK9626897.1 patatin-like phospholipase family protein [Flavobacteriales bacterium]MBP8877785.1 patatin-like phospholipase family protein [Flavobacteriales bacterium]
MSRISLSITLFLTLAIVQAQRVGLVLSGGGAVGMTHIGVMQALEENDIPIDYITGSSMGALIGALYVSGWSPWEIDSLFRTEQFRVMAEGGIEARYQYYFKQDPLDASLISLKLDLDTTLTTSLPTNLRSPALIDYEQMRGYGPVSAIAGYDMDSLFIPYRCVASDITAQRSVVFAQGDLAQAVRASMSYPFYFKPIRVNGHLMMDGGLYNNFPSDVMYDTFLPDFIVGSNVSYNSPPPSEDDLVSQLRAMMQERTEYSISCEQGVIIEPRTATTLFDFSDPSIPVADGYAAAMAQMPIILEQVHRRTPRAELDARRKTFRAKLPPMVFDQVRIHGLTKGQTRYVEQSLLRGGGQLDAVTLKPKYFRLVADRNIAMLYPKATWKPATERFDLDLYAKAEKDLEVRFGGMFSSRPINTGMIGLRYNLFGSSSAHVEALSYFGKFYAAGQVNLRAYLSTKAPIYVEPQFNLHRWDYFRSFSTFFDEVKPSFIVTREAFGGVNFGLGMGNKGLLKFDLRMVESLDKYYQIPDFSGQDTADATTFKHFTTGLMLERNSLNRKQHPNAGESLKASFRFVTGDELTDPGSTRINKEIDFREYHDWFVAKVKLDQYFLPRGVFRFGILAEGVFSTMPAFQNYTASIIRSPAFEPIPESGTYFIEQYRSPKYIAGGVRTIIAVAKNKFDLRLEAFVYQPYEPFIRGEDNEPLRVAAFTKRYYLGSGSMIYQSPLGPVWFNLSYFDGLKEPWAWSVNFGYILFNQKAQD